MADQTFDPMDLEHRCWRAAIDQLVTAHFAVIELDTVDLTACEDQNVEKVA